MKVYIITLVAFFLTQVTSAQDKIKSLPEISANGLFLGGWGTQSNSTRSDTPSGFGLQEAEFRFTSNVDAYFRGDLILAVERIPGEVDADGLRTIEYEIHPEVAYVETLDAPGAIYKIGKFAPLFGRHNSLHAHNFPFIDAPLANQRFFGDDGLNESGISASALMPSKNYQELVLQAFSGENENSFNSASRDDLMGGLYYRSLYDLSSEKTFEFNLTHLQGENKGEGYTKLYNLTLISKWRPEAQSSYRSHSWTIEYSRAEKTGAVAELHEGGLATWFQYQWQKRWWAQVRAEYFGLPKPTSGSIEKYSLLFAFVPTEFSAIRLQYDDLIGENDSSEQRVFVQLNITMGPHPAHEY